MLAILHYVDDYFGAESQHTIQHALNSFVRLVQVLLGDSAVSSTKCACAHDLVILGVQVCPHEPGIQLRPSDDKRTKWLRSIHDALDQKKLPPGAASKLAGQLAWGASKLFRRLGRAMLRPIIDQQTRYDGKLGSELRRALEWWIQVLVFGVSETIPWGDREREVAHLFCDAASTPACLGAVLFHKTHIWWTAQAAPEKIMQSFKRRKDQQIMGLELLAIALALSTFANQLKGACTRAFAFLLDSTSSRDIVGMRVIVHCDNSGSEVSLRI
jgi:hypothetical protein